ncbi:MAG TPA: hypothetical protein VMA98_01840 [Candidatus Acidoferrales bacterium]|nr:hypothetical protein [Candidatus Acidoferrales bacterium]
MLALALGLASAPARAWDLVCSAAIPATMIDKVDSATAYPGMPFRFKITITARIDNILVPENTIGYGIVREVTPAGNHDRNGSLVLEMRELVYGKQVIQVMADPRDTGIWAPAQTITEAATGYLPIPGIVRTAVDDVRYGKNVTIGPGLTFHIVGLPDPRKDSPCHKVGQ